MIRPEDVRLVSDFREPYDHHFASRHRADLPAWERIAAGTRTRQEDHGLLWQAGFSVPHTGRLDSFSGSSLVVAYLDPLAHRGDGKQRGTAEILLAAGIHPETYCCEVVNGLELSARGRSTRLCWVGRTLYRWSYRQIDPAEWRSNVGDVEITQENADPGTPDSRSLWRLGTLLRAPLIAADFVAGYAVDLDTAPGLQGCPGIDDEGRWRDGWRDVAESIAARWGELPFSCYPEVTVNAVVRRVEPKVQP